jgi:hypothetical protein
MQFLFEVGGGLFIGTPGAGIDEEEGGDEGNG